jgi:hypothetical protein
VLIQLSLTPQMVDEVALTVPNAMKEASALLTDAA